MAKYSGLLFVLFAFTDFKNGLLGEQGILGAINSLVGNNEGNCSYCRTANIRVQEIFANFVNIARFVKFSCMRILPQYSRGLNLSLKGKDFSYLKIREDFLHANCLWPKVAKFSRREIFLFYSTFFNSLFCKQKHTHFYESK